MTGLFFILWTLAGVALFIWGWRRENDLTTNEIPMLLIAAIMGPCTIIPVLVSLKTPIIICKRRDKK